MDDKAGGLRMAKTLYKYDGEVNKVVWFTRWNYAIKNYYSDDINFVPDPILGPESNNYISFESRKPGYANVDWGDGTKEQFPLEYTGSVYRIIFRSLNIEWRKATSGTWWFRKSDGSQYIPVPPHHYEDDDKNKDRAISVDFTCPIHDMYIGACPMYEFPVVDLPDIERLHISDTKWITDIPQERLSRATKLKILTLSYLNSSMVVDLKPKYLSDGITDKIQLTALNIGNSFNLEDIDNSGIRNIGKLVNLDSLSIYKVRNKYYFKELNDLPKLKTLNMTCDMGEDYDNTIPIFEVDHINQNLTKFDCTNDWMIGYDRQDWPYHLSGKGLQNLVEFDSTYMRQIQLDSFPDFFYEMRSMNTWTWKEALTTQERADKFTETLYNFVTGWEYITMSQTASDGKRNQFYGLYIPMYSAGTPVNVRPSGVEQAPSGFVKGQSNGAPVTPMERIYVLKNNYAMKFDLPPA